MAASDPQINLPGADTEAGKTNTGLSLIRGGPLYRLEEKTHLIAPDQWNLGRRILCVVLIGYVPLVLLTLTTADWHALSSLLRDYRVYARMLIAVPLLIAAQPLMDKVFQTMVQQFRAAELISSVDVPLFQQALETVRRLRDSAVPEAILLVATYSVVLFAVGDRLSTDATWAVFSTGGATAHLSPAGWYAVLVSQPLYIFLLLFAFCRWMFWVWFLWRVSRLRLELIPTHPDLCGGLRFLGTSPLAFVPVAFAACTVLGSNWRAQIQFRGYSLESFQFPAAVLAIAVLVIFLGPLSFFSARLIALRHVGQLQYGILAQLHSTLFHRRWIDTRPVNRQELLGAPEISSLTDLASSVENLRRMRLIPVGKEAVLGLAISVVLPLLPVVVTQISLLTVFKQILGAVR